MKYALTDIPALAATPLGRDQLRLGALHRIWPPLSRLTGTYRRLWLRHTNVVAVVGSKGKSTTLRTTQAALGLPRLPKPPINAFSPLALTLLAVRRNARFAVLEAGISRPGEMEPYARMIAPDTVVVTSIGSDHRRSFETFEATRAEKARMVEALPAAGLAVLNGDDPNVLWMRSRTRARTLTYGFGERNDVRAMSWDLDWPEGTRLCVEVDGRKYEAEIPLFGRPMALATLAGLTVAYGLGIAVETALAGLAELGPAPSRLQPARLANGAMLIRDELKSPEESTMAALDLLAEVPARRKLVLISGIEEPMPNIRARARLVGERIGTCADVAYVMGEIRNFAQGAVAAGMPREALISVEGNVREIAERIGRDLGPDDVLLVKGRSAQRIERVSMALQGVDVRCTIEHCRALRRCEGCPMVERGWGDRRVVT